jgi:hypothetical protein
VWVIGGGAVAVGLGVAGALFGMRTLETRDQIREAVAASDMARATALYDDGRAQQLRTNLLLGAAAGAGIATAVLAIFTNWSGEAGARREVAVVPGAGGASIVYGARF